MRDIRFAAKIIGKFKSIQSAIFAVVTVPVSYTHLDVYKRQAECSTIRR